MNGNVSGQKYAGLLFGNPSYHAYIDVMLKNSGITDQTEQLEKVRELVVLENITFNGVVRAENAGIFSANGTKILLNEAYRDAIEGQYTIADNKTNPLDALDLKVYQGTDGYQINDDQYDYKLIFKVTAIEVEGGTMNGRDVMIPLSYAAAPGEDTLLKTGDAVYAYDAETAVEKGIIQADTELAYDYLCEGNPVAIVSAEDGRTYLIFDSASVKHVDSAVTTYVYGYAGDLFLGDKMISQ